MSIFLSTDFSASDFLTFIWRIAVFWYPLPLSAVIVGGRAFARAGDLKQSNAQVEKLAKNVAIMQFLFVTISSIGTFDGLNIRNNNFMICVTVGAIVCIIHIALVVQFSNAIGRAQKREEDTIRERRQERASTQLQDVDFSQYDPINNPYSGNDKK